MEGFSRGFPGVFNFPPSLMLMMISGYRVAKESQMDGEVGTIEWPLLLHLLVKRKPKISPCLSGSQKLGFSFVENANRSRKETGSP